MLFQVPTVTFQHQLHPTQRPLGDLEKPSSSLVWKSLQIEKNACSEKLCNLTCSAKQTKIFELIQYWRGRITFFCFRHFVTFLMLSQVLKNGFQNVFKKLLQMIPSVKENYRIFMFKLYVFLNLKKRWPNNLFKVSLKLIRL